MDEENIPPNTSGDGGGSLPWLKKARIHSPHIKSSNPLTPSPTVETTSVQPQKQSLLISTIGSVHWKDRYAKIAFF